MRFLYIELTLLYKSFTLYSPINKKYQGQSIGYETVHLNLPYNKCRLGAVLLLWCPYSLWSLVFIRGTGVVLFTFRPLAFFLISILSTPLCIKSKHLQARSKIAGVTEGRCIYNFGALDASAHVEPQLVTCVIFSIALV